MRFTVTPMAPIIHVCFISSVYYKICTNPLSIICNEGFMGWTIDLVGDRNLQDVILQPMNFRVMRREISHIIRIFIICVTLNFLVKKPFLPRNFVLDCKHLTFFLCPRFCIQMKWNCVNSKENIPWQIKSDEQKPRERYHISIYTYLD